MSDHQSLVVLHRFWKAFTTLGNKPMNKEETRKGVLSAVIQRRFVGKKTKGMGFFQKSFIFLILRHRYCAPPVLLATGCVTFEEYVLLGKKGFPLREQSKIVSERQKVYKLDTGYFLRTFSGSMSSIHHRLFLSLN